MKASAQDKRHGAYYRKPDGKFSTVTLGYWHRTALVWICEQEGVGLSDWISTALENDEYDEGGVGFRVREAIARSLLEKLIIAERDSKKLIKARQGFEIMSEAIFT